MTNQTIKTHQDQLAMTTTHVHGLKDIKTIHLNGKQGFAETA